MVKDASYSSWSLSLSVNVVGLFILWENYHLRGTWQTLRMMDASDLSAPGSFF